MKNRADNPIGIGFVLTVLAGSLRAQVSAPRLPASCRGCFPRNTPCTINQQATRRQFCYW